MTVTDTPIFDTTIADVGVPKLRRVRVWEVAKALGVSSKDVLPYTASWGATRTISLLDQAQAAVAVAAMSAAHMGLVFTDTGAMHVADGTHDPGNNVLRHFMLLGHDNPPNAQGDRRCWVILKDLGIPWGTGPHRYQAVNQVTGEVGSVSTNDMSDLW